MSKLSEHQIKAMISRLESSIELLERNGRTKQADQCRRGVAKYRAELEERRAAAAAGK